MATTTNYSWTTPDDTALVKDGASAIRTLGSSVDTTVKALNPETTLGDLAYRSSTANVKTRLGLGTAGQVLTVNSGANAPEWATPSSGGMTLLSTTTLSGTSTTISSISGAYTDLLIIVNNPFVDTTSRLRINPNSTTDISDLVGIDNTTTTVNNNMLSGASQTLPTTSTTQNTFQVCIRNYAQTTYGKNFTFSGGTGVSTSTGCVNYAGRIATTSAISSIQITTLAGTPTFSGGQVLIYGVK
jgi:hypothetical protein